MCYTFPRGVSEMPDLTVKNEIKAQIVARGWSLTNVVKEINLRHPNRKPTTVQNISNKLTRGTIKYSEASEIAEIIGTKIRWG